MKNINNVIIISDTHCGCKLAVCPPKVHLDEGGTYKPSPLQKKLYDMWIYFWKEYVPYITKGEPYIIVHNGDAVDGVHHQSTTQITHNHTDQINIAYELLAPQIDKKNCQGYYHIRGTEAHVGKSGEQEEDLAQRLGAIPEISGKKKNFARWEMWMDLQNKLIHFTHHIGTTGRTHYETSAVMAEISELYTEAGRWGENPPDVIVRSHRHRAIEIKIPTEKHYGLAFVTPGWQLKTPFVHRIPGGRTSTPQIGGYIIRTGDRVPIYTDFKIWKVERPKTIKIREIV
ncbi:MAG: hypothetical protein M0R03_19815 [Novosphingobium sp.]|nr:hypothetical protein [Novosphingobium sp.]